MFKASLQESKTAKVRMQFQITSTYLVSTCVSPGHLAMEYMWRGQCGGNVLLLLWGPQGLNRHHQISATALLPAEPSCWPRFQNFRRFTVQPKMALNSQSCLSIVLRLYAQHGILSLKTFMRRSQISSFEAAVLSVRFWTQIQYMCDNVQGDNTEGDKAVYVLSMCRSLCHSLTIQLKNHYTASHQQDVHKSYTSQQTRFRCSRFGCAQQALAPVP